MMELDHTKLLILAVLLVSRVKLMTNNNIISVSIVNMFGTFLHELMHFCVGFLLNAKPVSFSLFPRKAEGGYVLGSVQFSNLSWYNTIPTAMAPLLLIVVANQFDTYFFQFVGGEGGVKVELLYLFCMAIIIDNAIPSSTDFRVAFGSIVMPITIVFVLILSIYLTGNWNNLVRYLH